MGYQLLVLKLEFSLSGATIRVDELLFIRPGEWRIRSERCNTQLLVDEVLSDAFQIVHTSLTVNVQPFIGHVVIGNIICLVVHHQYDSMIRLVYSLD